MNISQIFSFNLSLTKTKTVLIGLVIPLLLILSYMNASQNAYDVNPNQKLLPSFEKMLDASIKLATEDDARTGSPLLWVDTFASLERLGIGILLSATMGLIVALMIGMFPVLRALLNPLFTFLSNVNPMAILAILFMAFGTGSEAKIALIMFGLVPIIIATIVMNVEGIPQEQLIKSSTLNGSQWETIWYLIIPQMMPRLIKVIQANIGYAWVFIIAAESLAGSDGLGYRIALFKRKMGMDQILPYVAWISIMSYLMIIACDKSVKRFYPWFNK